jgi:hypothetical protein
MSWHMFVIELDPEKLNRRWRQKIALDNPGADVGNPIVIRYFNHPQKIEAVRMNKFTEFPYYPIKAGSGLFREVDKVFETNEKAELLRACRTLKKELRETGKTVWYEEPATYSVYVIRLKPAVNEGAFKERNGGKESYSGYFYVGQTDLAVEERYQRHLEKGPDGKKVQLANTYVHNYSDGIAWEQMSTSEGTLTELESLEEEARLARHLQEQGYAVWYN